MSYTACTSKLHCLHVKPLELFLDAIEEDACGIVDGIVEHRGLFLFLSNEGIVLVEKLDACNDDSRKEGKLEHTHHAAKDAVYPTQADGAEYLRHEPAYQAEEQGHDNQYQDECGDVGSLDRDAKRSAQPLPYRHVECTAQEQATDETSQASHLFYQPVAQATDEPDDEQHTDDDVDCLHDIVRN